MKKLTILLVAFFAAGISNSFAQTDKRNEVVVKDAKGQEENIDLPEGMTQEVDSLLALYYSQMYLRPDTNCNLPDFNPSFEKEVFMERLKKLPTVIEMPYNDVVQKFIDRYSGQLRRTVSIMLGTSNFYMPIFEQALESYGLPLELKYLPVIESGLNPKAVSRVGATGLWQFMLATGKRYGLEVNSLVDERCDPVKSSYAAAQYLRDLYKIFGDWNLVIAAYNAGPDNINKAIHRAKGVKDYWQIYPYLPRETRGYVPAFIAANYIMNYYCDHNICPLLTTLPSKTDTVRINRNLHFEQVAQVLNIDIRQLQELNPQYRQNLVNGFTKPMTLRLPANLVNSFIDNQDSIFAAQTDNLLTKRTEVEVAQAAPGYTPSKRSYTRSSARKGKTRRSRNRRERSKSITVRGGDTLSEIAERNNTTVAKLKKLNNIKGSTIRKGKKLRVK